MWKWLQSMWLTLWLMISGNSLWNDNSDNGINVVDKIDQDRKGIVSECNKILDIKNLPYRLSVPKRVVAACKELEWQWKWENK